MPQRSLPAKVFTVLHPGLFTTIQDGGRFGYRRLGVTVGGAMDSTSLALANGLVGNAVTTGALECTGVGPRFSVDRDVCIAVVGGQFPVSVDEVPVPSERPLWIRAGSTLSIGAATAGYRCYLAVQGGFDVKLDLGSQSTLTRFGIGGFCGRPLRAGDELYVSSGERPAMRQTLHQIAPHVWTTRWGLGPFKVPVENVMTIRALPGEQADAFAKDAYEVFWSGRFRVDGASDRMGLRLRGPEVAAPGGQMRSEPVVPGSVQVPPDGKPIVLAADCQTVGGYPKIATVIEVDLAKLAQARPGVEIQFSPVSLEEAIRVRKANEVCMRGLLQQIGWPVLRATHRPEVTELAIDRSQL